MNEEQLAWAQVYATIMGGLIANPENHLNWSELRERVLVETDHAMLTAKGFNS